MKCFNSETCEELGWQFPFEVYFGRKSNELVHCGLPENRGSPEVRKVSKPTRNDLNKFKKLRSKTRNERLIPMKGLQKEQLNILEKGINVLSTK